jgi:hypothetical protein
MIDEVFDGASQPGVEVRESLMLFPSGGGQVVDDCDIALCEVPAGHIVVVLASSEGDQSALWVPLAEAGHPSPQLIAVADPPWFEVGQPEFYHPDELGWVFEAFRQVRGFELLGVEVDLTCTSAYE